MPRGLSRLLGLHVCPFPALPRPGPLLRTRPDEASWPHTSSSHPAGSCRQGSTALPAPVSDAPPGGAPHPAAAPCPGCPVPTHPRSPCSAPPPGLTGQEAGCRDTRDRPRPQGKGGFSGSPDGADHVLTTGLKPECQRPLPPGPAPTCSSRQRLCFSEIWLFRACFSFSSCSRDSVGQSSRSSSQRAFSCGDGRAKR